MLPTWAEVTANVGWSCVPATGLPSTSHWVVTSSEAGSKVAALPVSVSPGRAAPLVAPETWDGAVTFGPSGAAVSATMTALCPDAVPTDTRLAPDSRVGSLRSSIMTPVSGLQPSNSPSRVRYCPAPVSATATCASGLASSAGVAPPRRTGRVGASWSLIPRSRNAPDVVSAVAVVRLATCLPWVTGFSDAVTGAVELDGAHCSTFWSFVSTRTIGPAAPDRKPPRTSVTSGRPAGTLHRTPLRPKASTEPSSQRTTAKSTVPPTESWVAGHRSAGGCGAGWSPPNRFHVVTSPLAVTTPRTGPLTSTSRTVDPSRPAGTCRFDDP